MGNKAADQAKSEGDDFVEVRIIELVGPALSWVVAKAEGFENNIFRGVVVEPTNGMFGSLPRKWRPDRNLEQGGRIMEREKLSPKWSPLWNQWFVPDPRQAALEICGDTFLIATMRAFSIGRFGDKIKVPRHLLAVVEIDREAPSGPAAATVASLPAHDDQKAHAPVPRERHRG